MTRPSTARAALAASFGLLLPGAGHAFLGRWGKGLVFFGSLGTLFVVGVAMQARLRFYWGLDDVLAIIVGVSQAAGGLLYVAARALGFEDGRVQAPTFDYANTFTAVAGLLNSLCALDAWDIGRGRRP